MGRARFTKMAELRSIDGGKRDRAKRMAGAQIITCACGSRTMIEVRVGIARSKDGKVIFRGTRMWQCAQCQKLIE